MEFWKSLSRRQKILLGFLISLVLAAGGAAGFIFYPQLSHEHRVNLSDSNGIILPQEVTQVTIYITGAVRNPGVYTLPAGSRIKQAIETAGGPQPNWDSQGINLAKRLEDEDMIVVPKRIKSLANPSAASKPSAHSKKTPPLHGISLNRATLAELQTLPGIGPGMAQRILHYRKAHGSFKSIAEMKKVPGLGKKKFEKIKPYLRL